MAVRNGVWGIEIGQCALKAVKLRPADDGMVELAAFDLIEHPKILSQPDAEPEELIKAAVEKFISRNEWQKDQFVIGVPGQQIFARFCKLPPVDPKKIPEIVKFEAGQQIPFDINDVVWDYQRMGGGAEEEFQAFEGLRHGGSVYHTAAGRGRRMKVRRYIPAAAVCMSGNIPGFAQAPERAAERTGWPKIADI